RPAPAAWPSWRGSRASSSPASCGSAPAWPTATRASPASSPESRWWSPATSSSTRSPSSRPRFRPCNRGRRPPTPMPGTRGDAVIQRIIAFSANNRWIVLILGRVCVLLAVPAVQSIPLAAIPDLSDTQLIVYSRWDRSPDIVEDQVTYPIVTKMLGAPKVKAVRGFSDFGFSYVYIVFEEGTDIYWARSRTLEYLS